MTKGTREINRYSISFKQMVVREIESGQGLKATQLKFGINGCGTIPRWLRSFGKNHLLNKVVRIETMEEKDQIKELQRQLKEAKVALADSLLAQRCLEIVIDEANKEYKTDLKKNFGTGVSKQKGRP